MKFGVEVTAVPRVDWEGYDDASVKRSMETYLALRPLCKRAHVDGHCIECPSPIFTQPASFKRYFVRIRAAMAKLDCHPHHPDMVCGGGHIHVGVPDQALRHYIFKAAVSRPYLPWVFSQPDEEKSCDNFIKGSGDGKYVVANNDGGYIKLYQTLTRHCLKTIEYRFFEAPLDWDEQWDHLDFALRFTKYFTRRFNEGIPQKVTLYTKRELNRISKYDAITGFRKLCSKLGLDHNRYQKYIQRNLCPRWGRGYKRR